jgi:L-rhamnose 1-dehydrogenase
MARLLEGKTAAITGGVTGNFTDVLNRNIDNAHTLFAGIGRAIVLEYARQGASIGVNYFPDDKSKSQFESLVAEAGDAGSKIVGVPGDIRKARIRARSDREDGGKVWTIGRVREQRWRV